MTERLPDFDVPRPAPGAASACKPGRAVAGLLLTLAAAGSWLAWWEARSVRAAPARAAASAPVTRGIDEELIVKLRRAGAYEEAAALLDGATADTAIPSDKRARWLKLQGDLLAQAGKPGAALASFYRAEREVAAESELGHEIARAVLDTLRRLGHAGAVRDELAERNRKSQGQTANPADPAIARMDGEDFTRSEFEARYEKYMRARIRAASAALPDPQEKERMERELRRQLEAPEERRRFLNQWVQEELLVREARQWKIEQHPDYAETLEGFERQLLVQLLLQTKVDPGEPTEVELRTYSESHRSELGLSTEPGTFSGNDLAAVQAKARERFRGEKSVELSRRYEQDVLRRHKVELFEEALSGASH